MGCCKSLNKSGWLCIGHFSLPIVCCLQIPPDTIGSEGGYLLTNKNPGKQPSPAHSKGWSESQVLKPPCGTVSCEKFVSTRLLPFPNPQPCLLPSTQPSTSINLSKLALPFSFTAAKSIIFIAKNFDLYLKTLELC
jgi:hypothetical protein